MNAVNDAVMSSTKGISTNKQKMVVQIESIVNRPSKSRITNAWIYEPEEA